MMSFLPTSSRERALATAFADLVDTLVAEHDVPATLRQLCRYCVEFLNVDAAGVLLAEKGEWQVETIPDQPTRLLFRDSDAANPCQDCVRTGAPIVLADVVAHEQTWPSFVAEARKQRVASAYALPMRMRATTHGVLGLFSTRPDSLTADRLHVGQALADAIMAGIMQHWELHRADTRADQLQEALDSRVVIEQAKGVLAQRGGIAVEQAFLLLRKYARSHSQSLRQVAGKLISDDRLADDILHVRG